MRILSVFLVLVLLISSIPGTAAAVEETILEAFAEEDLIVEELPLEAPCLEESGIEEPFFDIPEEPWPALFAAAATEAEPGLYFGLLHAHSTLSGGERTPEEACRYAREVAGLDFFALTDHSDSFDNADSASIGEDAAGISESWASGKTAAQNAGTDSFLGLFGFEMSWPRQKQLGHISTFFTPGFQSWEQPGFSSAHSGLEAYYEVLTGISGAIAQWNHPGTHWGTFSDFDHYSEAADQVITLMEVYSGENMPEDFSGYFRALDKGWHLAPTGNQGLEAAVRTALWADALTESGIQEALASYRVYATQDCDLEIHYTLDGHFMGSRIKAWQIGETADVTVSLRDPTDEAVGLVEVLSEGGETIASQTLADSEGTFSVSLSPEHPYYCLKITQPDGDVAITAPIWAEQEEYAGIQELTCQTEVPVQGEPTRLNLTLYNRESLPLEVEEITVTADGETILTLEAPEETEPLCFPVTITHNAVGAAQLEVTVLARLGGAPRRYSDSISLFFRQSEQIRSILVDGTHDNAVPGNLSGLTALAAEENISITVETGEITPEMLKACGLLVIPPGTAYEAAFLDLLRDYTAYGGNVLIWGEGSASAHQNRVLRAVSATMTLSALENASAEPVSTQQLHRESDWCAGISEFQIFRLVPTCSLKCGNGILLASAGDAVLLAAETLESGGTVFAACGWFLGDADLAEPENSWAEPFANQTIARNLLGMAARKLPRSAIRQARSAPDGTLLQLQGHVTAIFPGTLYLQDDTGGIAITGTLPEEMTVGTPLEITGTAGTDSFGPCMIYASHSLPGGEAYRHLPKTGDWKDLLDTDQNGGILLEIEGTCTGVTRSDKGGLESFTLSDSEGKTVTAVLPSATDALAETVLEGRAIRAIGILTDGSRIRVRSNQEVAYVPPEPEPPKDTTPETTAPASEDTYVNPKTGDPVFFVIPWLFSGILLWILKKRA